MVFSGTPCQIAGLQKFLGKEKRKSLFSIALVCHGVASPAALKTYLRQLSQKKGAAVTGVRFRDKLATYPIVSYENGISESVSNNSYMNAYQSGSMTRESCFVCPYTTTSREADVSIGDFWGIEDWNPEVSDEISAGISLLIGHTSTGCDMIKKCGPYMELREVPLKVACNKRQPNLSHPIERTVLRNFFLKRVLVNQKSFELEAKINVTLWKFRRKIKLILKRKG